MAADGVGGDLNIPVQQRKVVRSPVSLPLCVRAVPCFGSV